MTLAILFAFASAACLGAGVVTTQFGLRSVEPISGAAISVPAFTLLFLLLSPLLLAGEPVVWRGVPIFAAIGLVFPALLTLLTFASNRALGPVVTSTLGNLAPLFAVALAVVVLQEPLRGLQFAGLVIAVSGAVIITVTRPRDFGSWRTWALLLPLGGAVLRGVIPPVVKLGLEVWPSPLWACLIGYVMSSLVVLTVQRVRQGSFVGRSAMVGPAVVCRHRDSQWPERADAVCRRAPRADYAGRAAGGGLSAGDRAAERRHAASGADHGADRRRNRADGGGRRPGADRVRGARERHCAIGKSPLPAARLCNRRLACHNAGQPE